MVAISRRATCKRNPFYGVTVTASTVLLLAACGGDRKRPEQNKPSAVNAPPIIDAAAAQDWPTATATRPFYRRQGNDQRNSRLPGTFADGEWTQAWRVPHTKPPRAPHFDQADRAMLVEHADGVLAALDQTNWSLTAPDGRGVARSDDARATRLREEVADGTSALPPPAQEHRRRTRPQDIFPPPHQTICGTHPDGHTWIIARPGVRIVSLQIVTDHPHGGSRRACSVLERWTHEDGHPFEPGAVVERGLDLLHMAAIGDTIIAAENRHLRVFDTALRATRAWSGEFLPYTLSLDEGGRAYLIVGEPDGRQALWVVDTEGKRHVRYRAPYGDFPPSPDHVVQPPVVALDHTVVVVGQNKLTAVAAPSGKLLWTLDGSFSGVSVAANGRYLGYNSQSAFSVSPDGVLRELLRVERGEWIIATPLLVGDSELYVLTSLALYQLKARASDSKATSPP